MTDVRLVVSKWILLAQYWSRLLHSVPLYNREFLHSIRLSVETSRTVSAETYFTVSHCTQKRLLARYRPFAMGSSSTVNHLTDCSIWLSYCSLASRSKR